MSLHPIFLFGERSLQPQSQKTGASVDLKRAKDEIDLTQVDDHEDEELSQPNKRPCVTKTLEVLKWTR